MFSESALYWVNIVLWFKCVIDSDLDRYYLTTSAAAKLNAISRYSGVHCPKLHAWRHSQRRKSHCAELIQRGEVFDPMIALMDREPTPKSCQRDKHHDLRENEFALVYVGSLREVANNPKSARNQSWNRDQTKWPNSVIKSLTYKPLTCKRWDTTD